MSQNPYSHDHSGGQPMPSDYGQQHGSQPSGHGSGSYGSQPHGSQPSGYGQQGYGSQQAPHGAHQQTGYGAQQGRASQPAGATGPFPEHAYGPQSIGFWNASHDDRQAGLIAHLLGMLTGWIGTLIFFMIKKDEATPFVREHARQALNAQLTNLILTVGGGIVIGVLSMILAMVTFGIGGFLMFAIYLIPIYYFVIEIFAMVKANSGEGYKIPLAFDLVK